MKMNATAVLRLSAAVLALVLLAGCAGIGARTQDLLARDYRQMDDTEIQTYFYQLNDQLAREERAARGSSGGLRSAPATEVSGEAARQSVVAEELRQRQNEVRVELSRRGLRP